MNKFLFFAYLLSSVVFFSCSSPKPPNKLSENEALLHQMSDTIAKELANTLLHDSDKKGDSMPENEFTNQAKTEGKGEMKNGQPYSFAFENDTLKQELKLQKQNQNVLDFDLRSEDKRGRGVSSVNGKATLKLGDSETDEDENGEMYEVNEYVFEQKNCYLAIRLHADTQHIVRVGDGECEKGKNACCPYESLHFLSRKP